MKPAASLLLALALVMGCSDDAASDAGPGSEREGCGAPGSHSVLLGQHSCACEPGYDWCDEALDALDCCPVEDATSDSGGEAVAPDQACGEEQLEQIVCAEDEAGDPSGSLVWACNGERWVEVPGYATFECLAQGKQFAYGCRAGPSFLCGYGPGSPCDDETASPICVDEDIIDACVFGRRTIDRCSRLCSELEVFGPGFSGGACQPETDTAPAECVCE